MSCTIVWFRRDLRIANNPALDEALRHGQPVLPVYIHDPDDKSGWRPGGASRWWCHYSLEQLDQSLQARGFRLHYFSGSATKVLPGLVKQSGASLVCWNNLYEPAERKLEETICKQLSDIEIRQFNSHLLFKPGSLLNNQEQPYRVFTPFWKKARALLELDGVQVITTKRGKATPARIKKFKSECRLEKLGLLDDHPWHKKLSTHWKPGEKSAQKQLKTFLNKTIDDYDSSRDIPSVVGTSKLSPHLHFGEITPAQIYYTLQSTDFPKSARQDVERFITELGWREFAHHVLWHYPHTAKDAMYEKFSNFWPKKADKKLLKAWQQGNTGIPIVDAGMRELWETGWMHNRVRMIVGSLLTKNLGIHWQHGAKWFWDTLVDADLASNTLGWQWVAGCGVDAAPYYRIFNPETQAKRFDPELNYIRKWVPEIDKLTYRQPVVDLKASRADALERYKLI